MAHLFFIGFGNRYPLHGEKFKISNDPQFDRSGTCRSLSEAGPGSGYAWTRRVRQFPDVRHQLLEVKLQTSPTIDLGLVCPNSEENLDLPKVGGQQMRHCDVRYALFYAVTDGRSVTLTHFFLTTGEKFFTRFPQFQGKVLNKKMQIPLPATFFDD